MQSLRPSVLVLSALLGAVTVVSSAPVVAAQEASPSPTAYGSDPGPPPPSLGTSQSQVPSGSPLDVTLVHPGEGAGTVELFAANAAGDRTLRRIRAVQVEGSSSTTTFRVYPDQHKYFTARHNPAGETGRYSNDVYVSVEATASIDAVRNAGRDYTFKGVVRPAANGTVVSLYRVGGNSVEVLAAQGRTDNAGRYSIRRVFTGSGRFGFFVRAAGTSINESGDSGSRPTLIY